jgi:hypothetical protein
MKDSAEAIPCPTLLTAAENDPLAKGAQTLFDALKCKKKLVRFTAAEGQGSLRDDKPLGGQSCRARLAGRGF